jgi:hypothetical protein
MTKVYCNWIQEDVDKETIAGVCKIYNGETECRKCDRSIQLDYGVPVKDLLKNLKECT